MSDYADGAVTEPVPTIRPGNPVRARCLVIRVIVVKVAMRSLRRCSVPQNNNLGDTEVGIDEKKSIEEQSPIPGRFTLVVDRRLRLTFALWPS